MRYPVAVLAVLALTGCGFFQWGSDDAEVGPVSLMQPDCYTVDLFDPFTVKAPPKEMAEKANEFLGVWMQGAWNGKWCHDLYVTSVSANGEVEVLDAYGPWPDAGMRPVVFRRTGWLTDGVLTLHTQAGTARYWREGRYLAGTLTGALGEMEIMLRRNDSVVMGEPTKLPRHIVGS